MRLLAQNKWSGTKIYCDSKIHVCKKGDVELFQWECSCEKKSELVYNSNIGAEDYPTEGD